MCIPRAVAPVIGDWLLAGGRRQGLMTEPSYMSRWGGSPGPPPLPLAAGVRTTPPPPNRSSKLGRRSYARPIPFFQCCPDLPLLNCFVNKNFKEERKVLKRKIACVDKDDIYFADI